MLTPNVLTLSACTRTRPRSRSACSRHQAKLRQARAWSLSATYATPPTATTATPQSMQTTCSLGSACRTPPSSSTTPPTSNSRVIAFLPHDIRRALRYESGLLRVWVRLQEMPRDALLRLPRRRELHKLGGLQPSPVLRSDRLDVQGSHPAGRVLHVK